MTQKRVYRLVDKIINECDTLKHNKILLIMAREQLDSDVSDLSDRVDILLDVYLSLLDCSFDELAPILVELKNFALTVSSFDG